MLTDIITVITATFMKWLPWVSTVIKSMFVVAFKLCNHPVREKFLHTLKHEETEIYKD